MFIILNWQIHGILFQFVAVVSSSIWKVPITALNVTQKYIKQNLWNTSGKLFCFFCGLMHYDYHWTEFNLSSKMHTRDYCFKVFVNPEAN